VNDACYASNLQKLCDTIMEKRRGMLNRGVRLLHEKAPVRTVAVAKGVVTECGFEKFEHPPCRPDLPPSDY
jgi:hypothetical protein